MNTELTILCTTAALIALIHTLAGPDHYLPFIVMARARKWHMPKTALVTTLCGVGHIAGSVVLGIIGIAFGIVITKIIPLESFRGNLAAWGLIGFGFAYFVWGMHKAVQNRPHRHFHRHAREVYHSHKHGHAGEHAHVHEAEKKNITPWILFTIFVLGPCEPLIPILMYPAAKSSLIGLALVTGIFGIVTILTMTCTVMISVWGIKQVNLGKAERYAHATAGATICASGLAIQFLGL